MSAPPAFHRSLRAFLALSLIAMVGGLPEAWAQSAVESPMRGLGDSGNSYRTMSTIKLNEEASRNINAPGPGGTFPTFNLNLSALQPLSLALKVTGLTAEQVKLLSYYHMLCLSGCQSETGVLSDRFYQVYKRNRLSGKSNFVTADVILHGYFTYINTLTLKVVEDQLAAELLQFLRDLKDACVSDYRICEIADIKDDIQRNLAYILVAIKLISPAENLPDFGGASDLMEAELILIKKEEKGRSPIFNRELDYSLFKPLGFYNQSGRTRAFYSAYAWLSKQSFSLSDLTLNTQGGGGNSFRRAVLLFRALEVYKDKSGNALTVKWKRINDLVGAVSQGQLSREPTIYPDNMRGLYDGGKVEFKELFNSLAQPLSRARLLIAVKKLKPQGLDNISIFNMNQAKKDEDNSPVFRLFSQLSPVELDFLSEMAPFFQEEGQGKAVTPLGLLLLFAMGSPQASNTLSAMAEQIDSRTLAVMPEFVKVMGRRTLALDASGKEPAFQTEKRWALLSDYFKVHKKGSQACLLSPSYMLQRQLSACGAFVDSLSTYESTSTSVSAAASANSSNTNTNTNTVSNTGAGAKTSVSATANSSSNSNSSANTSSGSAGTPPQTRPASPPRPVKVSNFHYLEPSPALYGHISTYIDETLRELKRLSALPQDFEAKGEDFKRLCERFVKISEKELASEPLPVSDFRLLAAIDQVLPAICGPTRAAITLRGGGNATIGVGDPANLYVLFNTDQGPYLSIGGLYTYYEIGGGPFKSEHWARKLSFGFLRPPAFCQSFNVMEERGKPSNE